MPHPFPAGTFEALGLALVLISPRLLVAVHSAGDRLAAPMAAGSAAQTLPRHQNSMTCRRRDTRSQPARDRHWGLLRLSLSLAEKKPPGRRSRGGDIGPDLKTGRPRALPAPSTRGCTSKRWELTFFPFFIHRARPGSPWLGTRRRPPS